MVIKGDCPKCKTAFRIDINKTSNNFSCIHCNKEFDKITIENIKNTKLVSICPICLSNDFWIDKNFPKKVGIFFVIITAILVPFTYGLSFVILFILDLTLWFLLGWRINCYRCEAVFVGFQKNSRYKKFDLKLADYYKKSSLSKD